MAQLIKLKRSAVAGKVPTTGSLTSGEIAINTQDGKLFFRRDDDTVQSFFVTNALVTGSLQQSGSDSYFLSNVGIGTDSPVMRLTVDGDISGSNKLFLGTVDNATTDTNKFLVIDGEEIKYRTGAQIFTDIGANLQTVTDAGNVTTNEVIISSSLQVSESIYSKGEEVLDFAVAMAIALG